MFPMKYNNIYPLPSSSELPHILPNTSSSQLHILLFIFYKPLSQISAVYTCMGVEPLSVFLDQGLISSQTQYYIVTVQRMILGIALSESTHFYNTLKHKVG